MRKCPYAACDFEYTEEEKLDEHLAHMASVGDKAHNSDDKLRF